MHLYPVFITLLLLVFLAAPTTESNNTITPLSINCGSAAAPTAVNGREWIGDSRTEASPLLQIKGSSTASTVTRSSASYQIPLTTARISSSKFSYAFRVSPGEQILRLHFHPALYKGFERLNDVFDVEAGPFTLLSNFSASRTSASLGVSVLVKEFCLSVEENQSFKINFSPRGDGSYAFINGIEIIPVPSRLSYFKGGEEHGVRVVGQKFLAYIENSTALELIHRVNTKPDSVPFSDESGTWNRVRKQKENELSLKTPVDVGFRYLTRIHFSDLGFHIAETRGMNLRVLINGMTVDSNISLEKGECNYRDYVVAVKGRKQEKRDLSISLESYDEFADGSQLVKGFEVFKMSNLENSLHSQNEFPPQGNSPSWNIRNMLKILCNRNASATLVITIIILINIVFHKTREFLEARVAEGIRPSAKAERFCRRFSLSEIQSATKNFTEALLIGRGGFGKVYKGLIDKGREIVAIKRLKSTSTQGRHEFLTEIETLSELRHINLVSLIGYCSDYKEMIIVYEYMPKGTLADHLHIYGRKSDDSSFLTWEQRLSICIGAARGLDYLHTGHRVIHRDVKASNILLDEDLTAKVSDFGLAKPVDLSKLQSHVTTKVKGTHGYLDPYYCSTRKLTKQSDTYAFGVVLLEVLCERPAIDLKFGEEEYCLKRWALSKINEGKANEIVAASLVDNITAESLKAFVEIAERCLHDEPKKRPTMAQVVLQLESALELLERRKIAETYHTALVADNEDIMTSATAEPTHVNAVAAPQKTDSNRVPAAGKDAGEPKQFKRSRFSAWDAFRNRLKPSKTKELSSTPENGEAPVNEFLLADLVAATNDFPWENKIGAGSTGVVSRGPRDDGGRVAFEEEKKAEEKGDAYEEEKKAEEKGEDSEEPNEAVISSVMMKARLHCDGCARKVRRAIKRYINGVDSVRTDLQKNLITVTGNVDVNELITYLRGKLKRVEIVHLEKEDGANGEKKTKEGASGDEKDKGNDINGTKVYELDKTKELGVKQVEEGQKRKKNARKHERSVPQEKNREEDVNRDADVEELITYLRENLKTAEIVPPKKDDGNAREKTTKGGAARKEKGGGGGEQENKGIKVDGLYTKKELDMKREEEGPKTEPNARKYEKYMPVEKNPEENVKELITYLTKNLKRVEFVTPKKEDAGEKNKKGSGGGEEEKNGVKLDELYRIKELEVKLEEEGPKVKPNARKHERNVAWANISEENRRKDREMVKIRPNQVAVDPVAVQHDHDMNPALEPVQAVRPRITIWGSILSVLVRHLRRCIACICCCH